MVWASIYIEDDTVDAISSISDEHGTVIQSDDDETQPRTGESTSTTSKRNFEFSRLGMLQMADCVRPPEGMMNEKDYKVRLVGWRRSVARNNSGGQNSKTGRFAILTAAPGVSQQGA